MSNHESLNLVIKMKGSLSSEYLSQVKLRSYHQDEWSNSNLKSIAIHVRQ